MPRHPDRDTRTDEHQVLLAAVPTPGPMNIRFCSDTRTDEHQVLLAAVPTPGPRNIRFCSDTRTDEHQVLLAAVQAAGATIAPNPYFEDV